MDRERAIGLWQQDSNGLSFVSVRSFRIPPVKHMLFRQTLSLTLPWPDQFHRMSLKLCVLALAVLAFGLPNPVHAQGKKKGNAGPSLVKIDRVKRQPRSTTQSFVGSLQAARRVVIGSAVEERVVQVHVNEGDFVSFDNDNSDVLVTLDQTTIDIDLQAAEIELDLRQKALQELSTNLPIQLEAAQAEVGQLSAELEYTRQLYTRLQNLGRGTTSQRELDESSSQYNAAQQAHLVAKTELKRLQATKSIRMQIAEQNVASQRSVIKRLQGQKSNHLLKAPFSGVVSQKMVDLGSWVTRGTPLIEVLQLDPIELRVLVPQKQAVSLQQAYAKTTPENPLNVKVKIDSLAQTIDGHVSRIVPNADPRTRAIPVIVQLSNPAIETSGGNRTYLLTPGLLAKVDMEVGVGKSVLMVPKDALVLNQGKATLFTLDRTGAKIKVKQVAVQTGNSSGNLIEIDGDFSEDAEVVVQGNERLRNGEEVKILE